MKCRVAIRMFWCLIVALMSIVAAGENAPPPDLAALRRAVTDLRDSFPDTYPNGAAYLERIDAYEKKTADGAPVDAAELAAFARQALIENPLLKSFERIIVVRRKADDPALGLPQNWQGNCSLPLTKYHNEIASFAPMQPEAGLTTIFKPDQTCFVGDVDLHFDGDRLLFSMPGSQGRSQIWEIRVDGTGLRQITRGEEPDVDNYDACYLPDERIVYDSTANYQGVPCVTGSDRVANLCIMNADGSGVRQLCFDQDHDFCPAVLNNGRVLYTRWEYSDLPHSNSRLLFHMRPDGTNQIEYYGSNSYWPTSVMFARPVPGHPTQVAAIITGHHGVPRMGELAILDPAKGRREADGAVQLIPGYGKKVEPVIMDPIADAAWPKFLHPFPLSGKYLLVACQPTANANWGIYLVDVFDNMVLLREEPGYALLEPVPLRPTPRPPVIADVIRPDDHEATVYMENVYAGEGLAGMPRGTVKSLRVFSYTFSYRNTGGMLGVIGMDGPWDVKRILGTVPVETDGSALFTVPANTPISVQPLDDKGRALQLMRSWFTGMPGEKVSCVGCHDQQNGAPQPANSMAARRAPSPVAPWRGPARGFNFAREVQPVLDAYCVSCHDGTVTDRPDLSGTKIITDWESKFPGAGSRPVAGQFSVAYASLHKYVRRPGIESDIHMLTPLEFHASTTELVQMLERGHHGVALNDEAWDRLFTWIDLNTPFHGTWSEIMATHPMGPDAFRNVVERRRSLLRTYADLDVDYEAIFPTETALTEKVALAPEPPVAQKAAAPMVDADPKIGTTRSIDLGDGLMLEFAYVPKGAINGAAIDAPFWLGKFEITNEQFARFDAQHDTRVEPMHAYQFGIRGYYVNNPKQPVSRVSYERAMDFCRWLEARTGETFTLPTENQWEFACRAGASTPFYYGDLDTDFSPYANLADARLREFARNTYIQVNLLENPGPYDDWVPKDARFDDGSFLPCEVGHYKPNAWGLYDMHGNAWEWTQGATACGGSWYDRPKRAAANYRLHYAPWQQVFNVGFRVMCRVRGEGT